MRHWGRQVATLLVVCGLVAIAVVFRKPLGELKIDPWIAVVFLALVFHQPIADQIRNLRTLTTPLAELEFNEKARELAQEADEVIPDPPSEEISGTDETPPADHRRGEQSSGTPATPLPVPPPTDAVPPVLRADGPRDYALEYETATREIFAAHYRMAADHPAYAVIKTRATLNRIARRALRAGGMKVPNKISPVSRLPDLVEQGVDPRAVNMAREVMQFGNAAVHDDISISPMAAINYISAAEKVALTLVYFIASKEPVNGMRAAAWLY